jgi:predicted amidophosphoribosyltransferase
MRGETTKVCIKCRKPLPESEGCYIERRADGRSHLHFVCPKCLDARERSVNYVIWFLVLFFLALLALLYASWRVGRFD